MYRDENWEVVFETPAPKGAALLDEKLPGWADKIDLATFQIGEPQNCIIAQLYGNYFTGQYEILTSTWDCPDYGFDKWVWSEFSFADLQKEWVFLIEQRRTIDSSD